MSRSRFSRRRLLAPLPLLCPLLLPAAAGAAITARTQPLPPMPNPGVRLHYKGTRPTPARSKAAALPFGGTYGISLSPAWNQQYNTCAFQALTTKGCSSSRHKGPLSIARFFVPYDALSYYDTSAHACAESPAAAAGATDWNNLTTELAEATADGLQPEIVITSGTGIGNSPSVAAVPVAPDPIYGSSGHLFAGMTTAGKDYSCGVSKIMADVSAGARNHQWSPVYEYEAWNEPNGFTPSNSDNGGYNGSLAYACTTSSKDCGPIPAGANYNQNNYLCGSGNGQCGPLEAAAFWFIMTNDAANLQQQNSSFIAPTIDAGTISTAQNLSYFDAYYNQLTSTLGQGTIYWAVHDYDDPSGGAGTNDLTAFENELARVNGLGIVSVTESGVQLDNDTQSDRNVNAHACADDDSSNVTGRDGNGNVTGTEPSPNLGCIMDGHASAQTTGANIWANLYNAHSTNSNVITSEVFWYDYQLGSGVHSFDSALVDGSGKPRASYCVLYGSGCSASGNPSDYLDGYFDAQTQSWMGVN